jgi:MFS family permease
LTDESTITRDVSEAKVEPPPKRGGSHATRTLLVLVGMALLVNYVETMVIPGIPTIQRDLDTTATVASWITSAYLIVGSAVSPLFGKLGDIFGKKRLFLTALVFYMCGVGLAGFSPSIYILIFARALQGIGFAIIPLGLAIITDVFPRERVAPAQGIMSGTFAIGASAGLIVGSYVVQDLGWQYAFHTALVLSLVLFIIAAKVLDKDVLSKTVNKAVDYVGAAILMSGITLVLLYITEGPTLGWLSIDEFAILIPGAVLTVAFFFFENRILNPLIQLKLLRIRNVLVANLVGLISGMIMFLLFFAIVYYSQIPHPYGLSLDIIAAGLTLAPATLGMLFGGVVVGRVLGRLGPKPILVLGSALVGLGLFLMLTNRATSLDLTVDLVVSLGGIVAILVPIVNMLSNSLPRESIAVGMGMNTMIRNLGGAIGPVLATSIMASYSTLLVEHGVVIGAFPTATAFNYIFELGIALTVIMLVISLTTKNYVIRVSEIKDAGKQRSGPSA